MTEKNPRDWLLEVLSEMTGESIPKLRFTMRQEIRYELADTLFRRASGEFGVVLAFPVPVTLGRLIQVLETAVARTRQAPK